MVALGKVLDPVDAPSGRPTDRQPEKPDYVRSYLILRVIVGGIGCLMPLVVIFGDKWVETPHPTHGSLSAYYHTGMRDVFVASLCVIGVVLIVYKVTEKKKKRWENWYSIVAGICSIGIANFPTGNGDAPNTPFQNKIHEHTSQVFHYVFTGSFIASAILLSACFALVERERKSDKPEGGASLRSGDRLSRKFWIRFHWSLTVLMALGVGYMGLSKWPPTSDVVGGDRWSLLITELICFYSFSISWLAKGTELHILFPRNPPAQPVPAKVPEAAA